VSPFSKPVIIDNDCISNFQVAGVLEDILCLWPPGTFKIPGRVVGEAQRWMQHGAKVCEILKKLSGSGQIEVVDIDDDSDEEVSTYMALVMNAPCLGQGESESIAIAKNRGYIFASDDRLAKEKCNGLCPNVKTIGTIDILFMARSDGLAETREVNPIWEKIQRNKSRNTKDNLR